MNTTKLQAAQMIANKIDTKTQEEIDAMIQITAEIYGESILAMVSNLYRKSNPVKSLSLSDLAKL